MRQLYDELERVEFFASRISIAAHEVDQDFRCDEPSKKMCPRGASVLQVTEVDLSKLVRNMWTQVAQYGFGSGLNQRATQYRRALYSGVPSSLQRRYWSAGIG